MSHQEPLQPVMDTMASLVPSVSESIRRLRRGHGSKSGGTSALPSAAASAAQLLAAAMTASHDDAVAVQKLDAIRSMLDATEAAVQRELSPSIDADSSSPSTDSSSTVVVLATFVCFSAALLSSMSDYHSAASNSSAEPPADDVPSGDAAAPDDDVGAVSLRSDRAAGGDAAVVGTGFSAWVRGGPHVPPPLPPTPSNFANACAVRRAAAAGPQSPGAGSGRALFPLAFASLTEDPLHDSSGAHHPSHAPPPSIATTTPTHHEQSPQPGSGSAARLPTTGRTPRAQPQRPAVPSATAGPPHQREHQQLPDTVTGSARQRPRVTIDCDGASPGAAAGVSHSGLPIPTAASAGPTPRHTANATLGTELDDGTFSINDYVVLMRLGAGAHGEVHLAMDTATSELRAVKVMKRPKTWAALDNDRGAVDLGELSGSFSGVGGRPFGGGLPHDQEIAVMKRCRNRHLVRLFEVIDDPAQQSVFLVMQYMSRGTLAHRIAGWVEERQQGQAARLGAKAVAIDPQSGKAAADVSREARRSSRRRAKRVLRIVSEVAAGLEYLHRRGVVHRDVKPDNVLFDDAGAAHLSDYGTAELFSHHRVTPDGDQARATGSNTAHGRHAVFGTRGTVAYMAPEVFSATAASPVDGRAVDMWALGVTALEAYRGYHPFTHQQHRDQQPSPPSRGHSPLADEHSVIMQPMPPRILSHGNLSDLDTPRESSYAGSTCGTAAPHSARSTHQLIAAIEAAGSPCAAELDAPTFGASESLLLRSCPPPLRDAPAGSVADDASSAEAVALEQIIAKLLAPVPSDRPSARALRFECEGILTGPPEASAGSGGDSIASSDDF